MGTDLVIYGMKGSPFVRKVQVLLAEKGLDYDFEMASPFPAQDWFVEISPAKRIPVLRDRSVGAEGVAGTIPDSSAICAYLERSIAGRSFLIGDALSIADIAVATQFVNFELAGATVDASRWPQLAAYVERLHARPSFAACIADERQLIPPSEVVL